MSKRGSSIEVPESWLEKCRQWRTEQGLTLEETGALVARSIRRNRAYGIATVQRYLSGVLVTDELTEAFAKAMNVPHPITLLESPKHRKWCELGVRLDRGDTGTFDAELDRLERLVGLIEELRGQPDDA